MRHKKSTTWVPVTALLAIVVAAFAVTYQQPSVGRASGYWCGSDNDCDNDAECCESWCVPLGTCGGPVSGSICGNGVRESGEQCETDSQCDNGRCVGCVCQGAECGDGILNGAEECDWAGNGYAVCSQKYGVSVCKDDCQCSDGGISRDSPGLPKCGNGKIDSDERCDWSLGETCGQKKFCYGCQCASLG